MNLAPVGPRRASTPRSSEEGAAIRTTEHAIPRGRALATRSGRGDLARLAAEFVGVGAAYYVAARLGLRLAIVGESITPIWPPTGIALVAILRLGPHVLPAIAISAFLVNLPISPTPLAAVGIAGGNMAAPLAGVLLLRRAGFRADLNRARDAMALVVVGGMVPMLLSATVGATTLLAAGAIGARAYPGAWSVWWTGDAMGVLVFAPLLLLLAGPRRVLPKRHGVELALGLIATALVAGTVFNSTLSVQYLVFPIVAAIGWRYRLHGAAPASLLVVIVAAVAAANSYGPFETGSLVGRMATLQIFSASVATLGLLLSGLATEREEAQRDLVAAGIELESRVAERTVELTVANDQLAAAMAERGQALEELSRATTLLTEAQAIAHMGSWEWHIHEDRLTWSDELFRIYGREPQSITPSYESFLELLHPDDRDFVNEVVQKALRERQPFAFDHRIVRPDGAERVLHGRGQVVADADGTPVRIIGTSQDITEQRRAERMLRRFVANAAHELRTPLAAVSGMASVLATKRDTLSEKDLTTALDVIGRQGDRARLLIGELLDLSRIENEQIAHETVPVSVLAAVYAAIEAVPEGVRVSVDVPDGTPVLAQPERLTQIFSNLVENAHVHGANAISIEAVAFGPYVRVTVDDDGPGIPAAFVPFLFEPFSRTGEKGGTGLGLAIVRALTETFGGSVTYEPLSPRGSRFAVTLRAA